MNESYAENTTDRYGFRITDYQMILIIITIIGFIISTAFYVYFVYLPAARAEDQLDEISQEGEDLLTLVNNRIVQAEEETVENLRGICESVQSIICQYNANSTTGCPSSLKCILTQEAYPQFCNQLIPFNPSCTCAST